MYIYSHLCTYLKADGAVVLGGGLPAGVVVQHRVGQAQATLGAVEEVAPPTDPAQATPIAVELTLVRIVIETAGLTEVIAKLETTFKTRVSDLDGKKRKN